MKPQIIELDGAPAFAVVPIAEWRALLERLQDLQDVADAKAARDEEQLPLEFVQRLVAGESPLRLWREHRGLTLQQLADRAGCTRQMLSMVENGRSRPSVQLLGKLAAALGCDLDDLHAG